MLSLCPALYLPRAHSPELLEANLSGCSSLLDEAVELLCFNSPRLVGQTPPPAPRPITTACPRLLTHHCNSLHGASVKHTPV